MSRPCLQSATTQLLNRFSSTLRRPLSTITRLSLPSASVSSITRPDMRTLTTAPVLSYPAPTLSTSLPSISNILEDEDNGHLHIMKLTNRGFHLSDDLVVPGGLVLLENKPFLWDVDPPIVKPGHGLEAAWMGWDIERFKVFEVVLPRPEMLLFGTGERSLPVPKRIRDYISGLGIQIDVMDSRNAASTFNMLQEEGRKVAAALCPLTPVDPRTGGSR